MRNLFLDQKRQKLCQKFGGGRRRFLVRKASAARLPGKSISLVYDFFLILLYGSGTNFDYLYGLLSVLGI